MENSNENELHKPGYKQTEFGWIPVEWKIELLDKVAKRGSGHTPDKSFDSYYNGGVKWISLADSYRLDNGFVFETDIEISEEGLKNSSAVVHPAGTVVMSRDAGVGKSAIMGIDMAVSQHFIAWTCNGKLDNIFLYYWLQYKKTYFEKQAVGSTIKTIGLPFFKKLKIVNPTLPEQKEIAQFLSTSDALISKTNKLIQLRKQRQRALLRQLLAGNKRLPGFDVEWSQYNYCDIIREIKRPVQWDNQELYHLISVRRRSGGIFERERLYGHQIKVKELRTANEGDFLFSKMQIVHGASALVTKEFAGSKISGSYIAVVAKDEKVLDMEFFNWLSKTPQFYHQTYISSYGVHIEKMTFDFESFLSLGLKLPEIDEQKAIARVLRTAEDEIKLLQKKLEALKEQKKGLMQQLLTGKKRVRV